jgi:hypothetical protein
MPGACDHLAAAACNLPAVVRNHSPVAEVDAPEEHGVEVEGFDEWAVVALEPMAADGGKFAAKCQAGHRTPSNSAQLQRMLHAASSAPMVEDEADTLSGARVEQGPDKSLLGVVLRLKREVAARPNAGQALGLRSHPWCQMQCACLNQAK